MKKLLKEVSVITPFIITIYDKHQNRLKRLRKRRIRKWGN